MDGQEAKLRSLDVPGLIGYHSVTDEILVALARDGEELALLLVEGLYVRLAAKVTWTEAIAGNPFDVDELLVMMERGVANHGPAANARAEVPAAAGVEIQAGATPGPQASPVAGVPVPPATCPPGCTPMAELHRQLCERYFKGLGRRLRGRGARKARELVRLILGRIEWCRSDITGTRQEVHREIERLLERALAGGDRNIRDALDLLVKHALFVEREEGTRCTVLFSQLHDPGSELMQRIAAEVAAATPPPTAEASEDRRAEAGEGERGPMASVHEGDEGQPIHAGTGGAADADAVESVPAVSGTSDVVAEVAVAKGLSPAVDEVVDITEPVGEESTSLRPLASLPRPDTARSSASIHVYQALARTVPDPPAPNQPPVECSEFRQAPIITTKVEKPRGPDTTLRGFTRFVPASGVPPDPEVGATSPMREQWPEDDQDSS